MLFWRIKRRRPRRKLENTPQVEELRKQAKEVLPSRLAQLAALYGFEYSGVRIKHNVSNWGSCSTNKNINLNLNLMRVPEEVRDYVILHELCHLRYMNHGPEFHRLLESVCPDHKALAKQLKEYKLI